MVPANLQGCTTNWGDSQQLEGWTPSASISRQFRPRCMCLPADILQTQKELDDLHLFVQELQEKLETTEHEVSAQVRVARLNSNLQTLNSPMSLLLC